MAKKIPKYINPLISFLHFAVRNLPTKKASALMAFVLTKGSNIFVKSHNMRTNIRYIFPNMEETKVEEIAQQMLANFGRHIAEIAHISDFRYDQKGARIDTVMANGLAFDGKGPAIYVGAHVGSWELSALIFDKQKQPVTVIYTENKSPIIENLLQKYRNQTGAKYVEKQKALKPCYKALDRGESVALLVDQRVRTGIDVEFLGHNATFTRLPARLAINYDCPIIPFEVIRVEPGHLRVSFQAPIMPLGRKGKKVEFELTQKLATAVEQAITRNIEMWFCSKLRWKGVDRKKS
ncbi:MAG: lysophospholipid acyltransferase family protein [Tateyamaria sp.]|nr:lysophospholipid acyltransferase family protein [Tateyamaria sp.]MDG0982836.1 lysophospholipid acyltransferase family protein [Tateyamaria sp.]MDG1420341.1 lysophospholipid acyltransferase family protein [Tateyamaria sp.]MDG1679202.1 lysophospholipid acyltransferase family protein [Tateyamaria sp.]MDG2378881.1 lysophospholipid acyltransferase family protein [Tateyamaria sp.]